MTDAGPEKTTAGALLRAAREKQGLHIAALAAAIKVAPRKLDALENDRWDELPDATFTRALAQTVCRTLKVDPRPVLNLLPTPEVQALEPGEGALNEPFLERPMRDGGLLAGLHVGPLVWAAALLMLAAVAVYLWPASWWPGGGASAPMLVQTVPLPTATSASLPASASESVMPPDAAGSGVAGLPAEAAASTPPAAAATGTATPGPAAAPAATLPALAAPAAVAPPAPAQATAPPPRATGAVQLRASQPSWVEVRDGRGELLLSRVLAAGETAGVDGAPPLRVVVGNAAHTQLLHKGQPVDLAAVTRENVARIELP